MYFLFIPRTVRIMKWAGGDDEEGDISICKTDFDGDDEEKDISTCHKDFMEAVKLKKKVNKKKQVQK